MKIGFNNPAGHLLAWINARDPVNRLGQAYSQTHHSYYAEVVEVLAAILDLVDRVHLHSRYNREPKTR
jgi:hypothetical protein